MTLRTLGFSVALVLFGTDVRAEEPTKGTHAPDYSLWLGARLGMIGFGNSFYGGPQGDVTTGNLVQAGATLEADAGARLGKRHVPYLFYEQGLIIPGRALEGTSATITTRYFGLGFRYTALDPDFIGFLADVSLGWRTLSIAGNGGTYELSGLETFRLGLGAEIRLGTRVVVSPLAYVSGGVMTNNSGTVMFKDGSTPPFTNGASITEQRGYLVLGIGVGIHFDLIGK